MAFTPHTLSIGDYVFITSDISNAEGTFAAGTELEIIDISVRNARTFYDLRDHKQNLLLNVPESDLRLSRVEGDA